MSFPKSRSCVATSFFLPFPLPTSLTRGTCRLETIERERKSEQEEAREEIRRLSSWLDAVFAATDDLEDLISRAEENSTSLLVLFDLTVWSPCVLIFLP